MARTVDDYHNDFSAVQCTMLKDYVEDGPGDYKAVYIDRIKKRREPGKPALTGTIAHSICLEGKSLDDLVIAYTDDCFKEDGTSLNGKPAKAFREEHHTKLAMKPWDYRNLRDAIDRLFNSEASKQLATIIECATSKEQRYDAEIEGVACKAKPDILCETKNWVLIDDLKFTDQRPDDRHWRRGTRKFYYWLQDPHYSSIIESHFGKRVLFRFHFIETVPPFRIVERKYCPITRETIREQHRKHLRSLRRRMEENDWEDRWESVTTLEPWDIEDQNELVDVE